MTQLLLKMLLKIKVLDESVRELYLNHGSYNEGDSGLDLFVPEDTLCKSGQTTFVNLQIACEAFKKRRVLGTTGLESTSFYMYPRSSISKTPLRLANSIGIIDAGYRGPLIAAFDNISDVEYVIKRGTRLLQICSPTLDPITFQLKNELSQSTRGSGGYGSTGI